MAKILILECLSKTSDKNAGYALGPLRYLNGKAIKEFTNELVFVWVAVNKKIYAKFVL